MEKKLELSERTASAMQALDYLRKTEEALKKAIKGTYSNDQELPEEEVSIYKKHIQAIEAYIADLVIDIAPREDISNIILSK